MAKSVINFYLSDDLDTILSLSTNNQYVWMSAYTHSVAYVNYTWDKMGQRQVDDSLWCSGEPHLDKPHEKCVGAVPSCRGLLNTDCDRPEWVYQAPYRVICAFP